MNPVGNKVLLAGRGGFFAQALTRRFRKEGWEVFRLGAKEEPEESAVQDAGVHFCAYRGSEPEAADLFRTHAISFMIYIPERDMAEEHFVQLQAVLQLGHAFKLRRFFLLSSAEVFSPGGALNREEDIPLPASSSGRQYHMAEECVRSWQRIYGLPVTILRCPDIYGEDQSPEDNWLGDFLFRVCRGQPVEQTADEATRDFLYAEDAADAVFQAADRDYAGEVLHISPGEGISWKDFKALLQKLVPDLPGEKPGTESGYAQGILCSERCSQELGWTPQVTLEAGLGRVYSGMKEYIAKKAEAEAEAQETQSFVQRKKVMLPYLKNFAGFLLMAIIAWLQGDLTVNPVVYFDMNFLYIGAMGLLYGKQQSLIACVLSTVLFLWTLMSHGTDAVGVLYVPQYLLHVTSYLFTAVLAGYFADRKTSELESLQWEKSQHTERYAFLRQMYRETTEIKDKLYQQMSNMGDSFGRLYLIIQRLDGVAVENIFDQAAAVISEIMGVPDVAIYVVSSDRRCAFQRVCLGKGTRDLPRFRYLEDHAFIRTVSETHSIYVNRSLDKSAPNLAAPIVYRGEVIAAIELFGTHFDQWSLNQQNLLSITARMISPSIARACEYEENAREREYYGQTHILMEDEFCRILDAMHFRGKLQKNHYMALLRIQNRDGLSYEEIDQKLSHTIRQEDFVGLLGKDVYVLLFDVKGGVTELILERMKTIGLDAELSEAVTGS